MITKTGPLCKELKCSLQSGLSVTIIVAITVAKNNLITDVIIDSTILRSLMRLTSEGYQRKCIHMGYPEILEFARGLDRSFFIDNDNKIWADINEPLPIGYGQTISQPSLVVEMSQLLGMDSSKSVLEIGTGSGYQTAILAHFSKHVYTIERIAELGHCARQKLDLLGYTNISYLIGDGSLGWSEHAPYDRIIVTAAAGRIPEELLEQLGKGGIMIIPVGPRGLQELIMVVKNPEGKITTHSIESVRFVELMGKYGWGDPESPSS